MQFSVLRTHKLHVFFYLCFRYYPLVCTSKCQGDVKDVNVASYRTKLVLHDYLTVSLGILMSLIYLILNKYSCFCYYNSWSFENETIHATINAEVDVGKK